MELSDNILKYAKQSELYLSQTFMYKLSVNIWD